MVLNIKDYKDKVRACWLGKNIGGTLGTPFEGKRGVFDVKGYTHDVSKGALPNDDLDLQLVFLYAAEEWGTKINSHIIGEYWLNQIIAHWSEYGMGKCNMRNGLIPPLSGHYNNPMGNSCGCFIRSELWACLAPGHPEIAVKYALEDAMVDHSVDGLYAEIFTAALEAAAFAESDADKLVEIAFSYIPEDSAVAGAVKLVQKCYRDGKTWREARAILLNTYPDSFSFTAIKVAPEDEAPVGEIGFDAPANIGITMIGWYYGEGDFGKSLCIAASCGEDADCTCATLGSIFGIIGGTKAIPEEWIKPIGEDIKTVSLDLTAEGTKICKNITELTNRVTNLMPVFMKNNVDLFAEDGAKISINENSLFDVTLGAGYGRPKVKHSFRDELATRQPWCVKQENAVYDLTLDYCGGIEISEGVEKEIKLRAFNKIARQSYATVKVYAPCEWEVFPSRESQMLIDIRLSSFLSETTLKIVPHGLDKGIYRFPVEVRIIDRPTSTFIPMTFIVK